MLAEWAGSLGQRHARSGPSGPSIRFLMVADWEVKERVIWCEIETLCDRLKFEYLGYDSRNNARDR